MSSTRSLAILLHPQDAVAVAVTDLPAGTTVTAGGRTLTVRDDVPRGHKVAVTAVSVGRPVLKYGQLIGSATRPIVAGDHVHEHNLGMAELDRDYLFGTEAHQPVVPPVSQQRTFDAIVRPDGRAATRNYVGVLTSVNCSATVAKRIAEAFRAPEALAAFPYVDGVVALTHGTGCGMAAAGPGIDLLRRTLAGYARHPNFAALLVVGLGCEVNQLAALTETFDLPPGLPVLPLTIQELGGTTLTVKAGVDRIRELLPDLDRLRRTPVPSNELILGLNCGGSDGWSGITANPALGACVDLLIGQGGTAVLGETPEVYGAEGLLTRRAASREVGEALLERIRWWEDYTAANGGSMDNNPSPGNKAGGLTTILEKSLGAVAKGGSTALTAVYQYAEQVTAKGFTFMDTPGYDPVSVTGIVAGGAQLMCFTTGRGSVLGSKPAPTLKLATNSEIYRRMSDDMDVNCGEILEDGVTVAEAGATLFKLVLEVASGRRTKSEELGFGDEEFQPWQLGAVM